MSKQLPTEKSPYITNFTFTLAYPASLLQLNHFHDICIILG